LHTVSGIGAEGTGCRVTRDVAALAPAELEDDYDVLVEYFQDHTTNDVVDADQRVIDAITHVQDHVGEHCSGLD
jgi:hypothetical protein